MTSEPLIWIVGIQCRTEDEAKFNTWYDDVHVPMLLKGDCVKKVPPRLHYGAGPRSRSQVLPRRARIRLDFPDKNRQGGWKTSGISGRGNRSLCAPHPHGGCRPRSSDRNQFD